MTGLTTLSLLLSVVASGPGPNANAYTEAYQQAAATGRPLLVLVGAKWCPACRVLKDSTLPELKRAGSLDNVAFVAVDADEHPKLADRLMRGSLLPQLIVFATTSQGWRRAQIIGACDAAKVKSLIDRALQWQRPDRQSARPAAEAE